MAGPRWRTLADTALRRPAEAEPIEPGRLRAYWALNRAIAVGAIVFDLGLWLALRDDPRLVPSTLDTFAAINLPILAILLGLAHHQHGRDTPNPLAMAAGITITMATVLVWIQVSGTLSSYFVVAGAMLVVLNRALLDWSMGVVGIVVLLVLHLGAFGLEELGVLDRAPLFRADAGPIYASAAMRWSVMGSLTTVYLATWMGANTLIATLRRTERALDRAERRLAAAADFARQGRLTGAKLAGYHLQELIGRGGMAEVYRAVRGRRDSEPVAIKVVHPFLVDDETIVARARREAALAARLPPGVTAAVREVHLAGPGERLVVLEYLEGEDLAALLRRRQRLPPDQAVAMLASLCDAVTAVHAAGIIHRDLKPHNLFVVADGSVRVLDFGVARATDDDALTRATAVLGTPGYMAPEMMTSGAAAVGIEADIYALGVIAYQVLTGTRPVDETASAMTSEPTAPGRDAGPTPPGRLVPDVPPALDAVILQALSPVPASRPSSAAELAAALRRACPPPAAAR